MEGASVEWVGKGVIQNVGTVTSACHSTDNRDNVVDKLCLLISIKIPF